MSDAAPTLVWFTRDLRLGDHPALAAAVEGGGPVIPVFVAEIGPDGRAVDVEGGGAASLWRLGEGLGALAADLEARGGRLLLRRGAAADVLAALAAETGARRVHASRSLQRAAQARARAVKDALEARGAALIEHDGRLLTDPEATRTKTGGCFKVYTPFWKAVGAAIAPVAAAAAPGSWPSPDVWPSSVALGDLGLAEGVSRGAAVLAARVRAGEAAALERLDAFLETAAQAYHRDRDRLDLAGASGLSPYLAAGEISPGTAWRAAAQLADAEPAAAEGLEVFCKELVWREFAWHLLHHTPHIAERNWRGEWDAFEWAGDSPAAERWRRGQTGVDVIDAAMRELYVSGVMHNRARMLVASYLTKHLLTDWRIGAAWFADCLIDFDPASNAMGWQWCAGSGPDAAPFFRIFNPETQAEKFDPQGRYRARWLPDRWGAGELFGGDGTGDAPGWRFFDAVPRSWALAPSAQRPDPMIDLKRGRERALAAHKALSAAS